MSPSVVFTPEAEDQLAELYRYIAAAGSAEGVFSKSYVWARIVGLSAKVLAYQVRISAGLIAASGRDPKAGRSRGRVFRCSGGGCGA